MNTFIRKMRISDYEEAIHLWKSLPGMGLSGADEKPEIIYFLGKNQETCFVAVNEEKLIGTILGGSDGRRGYIYHLAVQQSEQKKGIGKKLLQACISAFQDSGIQKCHIFVIIDNISGIAFWKRMGWNKRDDILVMSKNIPVRRKNASL